MSPRAGVPAFRAARGRTNVGRPGESMDPFRTPARLLRAGAVVLAAAPLARCAPAAPVVLTSPAPSAASAPATLASADAAPRRGALTDHVVVISIDGLRPDAIGRFHARTLE